MEDNITIIEKLLDDLVDYLPTLGSAALLLLIGLIVKKIVLSILNRGLEKSRLDKTIHGFVRSAADILITILIVIIVLSTMGIPMTSMIAVLSAAGLAISLALQNSLSNVAGGFIILFSHPFKAGDYISAAGVEGTVEEITVINTKITTIDNKAVYIPNGTLAGATVTNYTHEQLRRVDLTFSVSYEDDPQKAIAVISEVCKNHPKVLSEPAPLVRIIELASSSVDIVSRTWVNSADYWDVYFDLIEQVKAAFDENNITIPYNHINVHNIKD
ncbi:MAG: mechanosensitive ion channel family protein [Oscillospiraceae bacterium]